MKTLLILSMPLMIVFTCICSIHFYNENYLATSFILYLLFWTSVSLWITALSAEKNISGQDF